MLRPEAVLSEEEEEEEPVDSLEDFHSRLRSLWSRPKTRRMSGGKKKKKKLEDTTVWLWLCHCDDSAFDDRLALRLDPSLLPLSSFL